MIQKILKFPKKKFRKILENLEVPEHSSRDWVDSCLIIITTRVFFVVS